MSAPDTYRGHRIEYDAAAATWRYVDTRAPVRTAPDRACGHCGRANTPEGHDACLGALPGVMNACCGHGDPRQAYIQFANGLIVRGFCRVESPLSVRRRGI